MYRLKMLFLLGLSLGLSACRGAAAGAGEGGGKALAVVAYTHQFTNVYFIKRGDRLLMVDTGLPGDFERIIDFMAAEAISPLAIDYIVLTHGHPDHAGNAAAFQERFGTKIIAGAAELEIIHNHGADSLCPRGIVGYFVAGSVGAKRYDGFAPDLLVRDSLDLAPFGWPGVVRNYTSHTAGSLTLFLGEYAFVGDLIKGQTLHPRRPAFHLIMCDLYDNLVDLEAVLRYRKAATWYPGHFGPLDRADVTDFVAEQTLTKQPNQ